MRKATRARLASSCITLAFCSTLARPPEVEAKSKPSTKTLPLDHYYIFSTDRKTPPRRVEAKDPIGQPQAYPPKIDLIEEKAANPLLKLWIEDELRQPSESSK